MSIICCKMGRLFLMVAVDICHLAFSVDRYVAYETLLLVFPMQTICQCLSFQKQVGWKGEILGATLEMCPQCA